MEFLDFKTLRRSSSIELVFPGWKKGERVAFLSPHDDDVLLGAGYLVAATIQNGGIADVIVFCRGDAGYSSPEEKEGIVTRRKIETVKAYGELGVSEQNISFLNIPDFSLMQYVNREIGLEKGLFDEIIRRFRQTKVSRVVFSSGYFEHWDHTAVFYTGIYTSPQATDPILADLGTPHPIESYLIYSVWADFEPTKDEPEGIRADKGILVREDLEARIRKAITAYSSQRKIIQDIVAQRERIKSDEGYLELYRNAEVRKPTDFSPYFELLSKCKRV